MEQTVVALRSRGVCDAQINSCQRNSSMKFPKPLSLAMGQTPEEESNIMYQGRLLEENDGSRAALENRLRWPLHGLSDRGHGFHRERINIALNWYYSRAGNCGKQKHVQEFQKVAWTHGKVQITDISAERRSRLYAAIEKQELSVEFLEC